ncbi:cytochrome P450 [Corynascus novoguineensis]|uniref:Cytochrome P450 n=1 Tax=Corynascus novoguineensis TaxID=1126955 RepID=A0AAN7CLH7_9PEZI|nr:cytochrome P450 [Corynascus novoguineensis]
MPVTLAIAVSIALLFTLHALGPRVDPREPPLLKPRIPFIGHIVSMMRHQTQFHISLQRSTGRPIATLPMLAGKIYAVWDPYLIASGLRTKSLSTTPHLIDATPRATQVSKPAVDLINSPRGLQLFDHMILHVIPSSLKGGSLQTMTTTALADVASQLTSLAPPSSSSAPVVLPSAWLWIRHLLTAATTRALYGEGNNDNNPFATDPRAEPALWELERHLLQVALDMPGAGGRAGRRAREELVAALAPYYAARRDENAASGIVRARAAAIRDAGMSDNDIARLEIMLPFAALANTVPLLFWLFCHVFSRPDVVERARREVEGLVVTRKGSGGEEEVALQVTASAVEERCPLLISCYRETQRVIVHQVCTRNALEDTVLTDRIGRQYLLKKGGVVQMIIGTSHNMPEYWGDDVDEFKPERFLNYRDGSRKGEDSDDGPGSARAMRAAFQPFGGGIHLCPGRHFAFSEMMAVMATLLLGYEVEPLEGTEWKLPPFATRSVIDAVTKPAKHGEGLGVRIKRRPGWEGVRWRYES